MRKLVIAGGSGFLGKLLAEHFTNTGDKVIVLARNTSQIHGFPTNVTFKQWDGKTPGDWVEELESSDALINLTGKNVNCRYTEANKNEILESRILSTVVLGECIRKMKNPPKVWINASSATIYNASYTNFMTEECNDIGDDFSMTVCKQWEHTFNNFRIAGVRKVTARIGIVLGDGGGAFQPLRHLASIGFGGRQGDGSQFCSWIHASDFCHAMEFFIGRPACRGVYNVTAPGPVTNETFMKLLRNGCEVSVGIPIPETLLEIGAFVIGTETELLLKSRKVFPKRLLDEGFVFEFNDAKEALYNLCRTKARKSLSSTLSH